MEVVENEEDMEEVECELCRGDGRIPCEQCGGMTGGGSCNFCSNGIHKTMLGLVFISFKSKLNVKITRVK